MSGIAESDSTTMSARPSSSTLKSSLSSAQNPSVKINKKEFSLGITVDNDKEEYAGTYSDSGEDSEQDQANGNDDDDQLDDQAVVAEDDGAAVKKSGLYKKTSKKATKKPVAKQAVAKRKPYQLVMNVSDTQYPVVRFVGKKLFKWKLCYDAENNDCDLVWTDNAVQPETLGKMQPHQKINHFPGMFILARKNYLARNLKKMKKQFPEQYKFFPQTWLLPGEYNELRNEFEKTSKGKCKTFIVKPEASCQGRGIFLTRNLDDLNSTDHYVVQRYLAKPYLLDGLKFDFRIYVLLAGCDPMRIYVFKEGLARLATEEYQAPHRDNLDDLCMHLTNYAINKDNPNFEFNEDENNMDVGHKRSMTSVMKLLEEQGHDIEKLWDSIKDILIKTIVSAQPTLSHHYKSCQPDNYMNNMCFEILGFDVILDSHLRPWLLEINHTPSFTTDTPLDSLIKKNCIRDALILMNLNNKTRNEIMQSRREQLQKRVLTGKKVKLTVEEKQAEISRCQQKRDEYETKNLGNYEKVYPLEPGVEDIYVEMQQHAQQLYENWTGANIRRNSKKEPTGISIGGSGTSSFQSNAVKSSVNPSQQKAQANSKNVPPASTTSAARSSAKQLPTSTKQGGAPSILPPNSSGIARSNTQNLSSTQNSQSSKQMLRKQDSQVNQDSQPPIYVPPSIKLGSISQLESDDYQEPVSATMKLSSNQLNVTLPKNNIPSTSGSSGIGYIETLNIESPLQRGLGGVDPNSISGNGSGLFQKPHAPHTASTGDSRKQLLQVSSRQQTIMTSSAGLSSQSGVDEGRQQNIKKYASMVVDLNSPNSNPQISKKGDFSGSNITSSTDFPQPAYQYIRQSSSQNSTLQALQPQFSQPNTSLQQAQAGYINTVRQITVQQSQLQQGKMLPGLIRNGFAYDNINQAKFQPRQVLPDRNINNNGLYLQPKLFDLNMLTKISNDEEQIRREQVIRAVAQIPVQQKQPAFQGMVSYDGNQRNILSQNSTNAFIQRRK